MKYKIIIFLILMFLMLFLIYVFNQDKEIYYVNIDTTKNNNYQKTIKKYYQDQKKLEKYINEFSKQDYRTTDLIRDIKDNKKVNNQTIQNALIKSDLLILNVGINDINYKIGNTNKEELYQFTDQVLLDIEDLFKLIRIYSKEKVYFIGFKNTNGISYNEYYLYTNKRLKSICNQYKITFIDINKEKNSDQIIVNTILNNIY